MIPKSKFVIVCTIGLYYSILPHNVWAQPDLNCPQTFSFTGALQSVAIPAGVTTIEITSVGGDGGDSGSSTGGSGATSTAMYAVTPGDVLEVIVGGSGSSGSDSGGGGGGSGVYNSTTFSIMVISGGGGGAGSGSNDDGDGGLAVVGTGGGGSGSGSGSGSESGIVGGGGSSNGSHAGGGGGILGAGDDCSSISDCTGGGPAVSPGGAGGSQGGAYGYGGGGGVRSDGNSGGGGGGYSGGDAGSGSDGGGGGGTFSVAAGSILAGTDGGGTENNGVVTISCTVLPIELLWFSVEVQESSVVITWETASEINNKGFDVQRSRDAFRWEEIGHVVADPKKIHGDIYRFVDEFAQFGTNYYRIRQIDFDGVVEYFPVLHVDIKNKNMDFSIYPIPAFEVLNVELPNSKLDKEMDISIYNVDGEKMKHVNSHVSMNSIDIQSFASGIYFVHIFHDGKTYVKRMVKN